MNKLAGKISVALISLTIIGEVAVALASGEKQQYEKPSFSPGDYWVYSTPKGEERREYLGEEGIYHVFMVNGTKQLLDANLTFKGNANTYYQFPLYVGKHWSYDFDVQKSVSGGQRTVRTTCEVEKSEPVETPAGTFQALNISCYEIYAGAGSAGAATTRKSFSYWYAPEVKQLIKNTGNKVLKEYKINK